MSKATVIAGWSDVPHLDEAAKAELSASYMPHEVAARTKGTPSLGAGAIYPVPEEDLIYDPFEIPAHWRRVYALDVGWNRTACLWGAIDPDEDILCLYSEYYRGQAEPAVHAQAIKSRGEWIPGVIDPASRGRAQKDGEQLYNDYTELGLKIVKANNAVEAGIYRVFSRLSTGRLRVFSTMQNWRMEYRMYRRDEKGKIVKENDHLMDCTRYLELSGIMLAAQMPVELQVDRLGAKRVPRFESAYSPLAGAYAKR